MSVTKSKNTIFFTVAMSLVLSLSVFFFLLQDGIVYETSSGLIVLKNQDTEISKQEVIESLKDISSTQSFFDLLVQNGIHDENQRDARLSHDELYKNTQVTSSTDSAVIIITTINKSKTQSVIVHRYVIERLQKYTRNWYGDAFKVELIDKTFSTPKKNNISVSLLASFFIGSGVAFILSKFIDNISCGFRQDTRKKRSILNFISVWNKDHRRKNTTEADYTAMGDDRVWFTESLPKENLSKHNGQEDQKEVQEVKIEKKEERQVAVDNTSQNKKMVAPRNLPVLDLKDLPFEIVSTEKNNTTSFKKNIDTEDHISQTKEILKQKDEKHLVEPTPEEVKERLNKLLKGEI